ncbi:helix-turn-helix transcriptional regulator [Pendulispora albinea]|uniref:Helix-turn-helix transcriptional regulator n=1 Tax=Pendulispora albinea TaxID=2741071 RepID=A0ABZ2LYS5_9BACT
MKSRPLRWEQLRRLMRLVGEASELPAEGGLRQGHVLEGLRQILNAATAAAVLDQDTRRPGAIVDTVLIGFDDVRQDAFDVMIREGGAINPAVQRLRENIERRQESGPYVATDGDLVRGHDWSESPYVLEYLRPSGLDHMLVSAHMIQGTTHLRGSGFFRRREDRPFDERDRNVLELFLLDHASFLWPAPVGTPARLAPREAETLKYLLAGASDKSIAAGLGISVHTARQYVKSIYRAFGVGGRAELLARHMRGSWV